MTENIYLFFLTRAGTHTCRGCKMQDLVKCESKIQVVIPLGKGVLTHRTWYFLLQLGKVFELRGITTSFVFIFFSWRLRDIHFPHLKNTKPKIAHKYLIFSWYLNGVYACRSWRQSDVPIVRHINNNKKNDRNPVNWMVVTFLTKLGHIVFSDGVENIFFSRKMAVLRNHRLSIWRPRSRIWLNIRSSSPC